MSDNDTGTQAKEGEDQTPAQGATDKEQKPAGATQEEETVVLPKKDYDNLVSQRDKNHADVRKVAEDLSELKFQQARDDFIDVWMKDPENSKNYPDVTKDDLKRAINDDDVTAIAKTTQKRVEDIRQQELEKIQVTNNEPQFTPEEKATRLTKIRKDVKEGKTDTGFEDFVSTQLS